LLGELRHSELQSLTVWVRRPAGNRRVFGCPGHRISGYVPFFGEPLVSRLAEMPDFETNNFLE
jgi:hypothetical protein